MFIMNEGHFKGGAEDLKDIHNTIENIAVHVESATTYTDRSGRDHLYIEFVTFGKTHMESFRRWQQVEMTINWVSEIDEEWSTWEPAIQRARRLWGLPLLPKNAMTKTASNI